MVSQESYDRDAREVALNRRLARAWRVRLETVADLVEAVKPLIGRAVVKGVGPLGHSVRVEMTQVEWGALQVAAAAAAKEMGK